MKISSLVIGKGSGSAGNITVNQLKGQTILKQKASIVANPNTQLQQAQRKVVQRAVYAWQMVGNTIKQGWTSMAQTWSQYNAFVSANAQFFKDASFSPATFQFLVLKGAQATKGKLGTLNCTVTNLALGEISLEFDHTQLNNIAKVGDKIAVVVGDPTSPEGAYDEVILSQANLDAPIYDHDFQIGENGSGASVIGAVYLVTADKKDSTTSYFQELEM